MNIHHLHINTKNDQLNDNNNYRINLPSNRIVLDGDAYLQINNFFCIKNWYALQQNYNDKYVVSIDGVETVYSLGEGNPRILDIVNILKAAHSGVFTCNYDYMRNKIFYKNTSQSSVFIRPVNSGKFLSLFDNVEFEITTQGVYSNSIVNVSGDSTLLIHIINADFTMINASLNNLDQDEDGAFNESQIILTVPINVPPYSLISYSSTGDILDRHRIFLHSKSIQGFNIYITNEHGVIIPNLTDYNISMSFFSEETEVNQSFKMVEILNDIFILIGNFIQELKAKFFI
jgi:hypothetical protein